MKDMLRTGWHEAPIGELFKTVTGNTPPKSRKELYGIDVPLVKPPELEDGPVQKASDGLTIEGASVARVAPTGSVLVSCIGILGKVGLAKTSVAFNQQINAIFPDETKALPEFIFYQALSPQFKAQIEALATGTTVSIVNKSRFNSIRVSLPPLEEQRRIVAVLDEAFEGLARARANAEANLQNARELFASCVASLFETDGEESVPNIRLGSLVHRLTNGYVGPTRNIYVDGGIPYLLARHVRDNRLKFDGKTFVTNEFNEKHKKSKLKSGDVLLVQSGHIGHCAVVPNEHDGHNCHAMIVISVKEEILSGRYLSALFNTPDMQARFQEIRTGSTVPHLTCKMVKELLIPVPSQTLQSALVDEIDELRGNYDALVNEYEMRIASIDDLRRSLLQQAFVGALT